MATKIEIIANLREIGERNPDEEETDDTSGLRVFRPRAVFEYLVGGGATIDLISIENAQALGAFLYRKVKITIEPIEETT